MNSSGAAIDPANQLLCFTPQVSPHWGERIADLGRHAFGHMAQDQPLALQSAQLERKHALRDLLLRTQSAQHAAQLRMSPSAHAEHEQNKRAPAVAQEAEDHAHGFITPDAVLSHLAGERGHRRMKRGINTGKIKRARNALMPLSHTGPGTKKCRLPLCYEKPKQTYKARSSAATGDRADDGRRNPL